MGKASKVNDELLLKLMTSTTPQGLLVVDNRTDEILYFNHQFCEIWGITQIEKQMERGEFKNNDIIPFCLPSLVDIPAFAESCKPLQSEENRITIEDFIPFINGRTVRRFSTQMRGDNDEYFGRFYIFEDITNVKETENALILAKEAAEAATLAKSQFLSNMSHEIRTPLNAIVAYLDLLENTEISSTQTKYLDKIKISSRVLLNTINDILDLSKLDFGKVELESIPVFLDEVINNCFSQVKEKAEKKRLEFQYQMDSNVPLELKGDPLRLQQIILNLLENAVKFTEKGIISIMITAKKNIEDNYLLEFSVKDTGIGMTAEQLKDIFEPFSQGDQSTSRKYGGTGLGLSICKHLVGLFGGEIWVESTFGKGSTFYFTANFKENTIIEKTCYKKEETEFKNLDLNVIKLLTGKKVLLAEDNQINQDLMLEILQSAGMDVKMANNGLEAIEFVQKFPFDIVLMDIRMPDMDGYEAVAKIRENNSFNDLPIIAVTASASFEDANNSKSSGFNDYIIKPIAINQLLQKVALCLQKDSDFKSNFVVLTDTYKDREGDKKVIDLIEEGKEIYGVNISKALNGLSGNKKLLTKLLLDFNENQGNTAKEIKNSLERGDMKKAERLAHTLLGVAGYISADKIYEIAKKIESELNRKNLLSLDDLILKLDNELEKVIISLNIFKTTFAKSVSNDIKEVDVNLLKQSLDKLRILLKGNDMEATDLIEEIQSNNADTPISNAIINLKSLIDSYRFEEGIAELDELYSNLK
jgi:signal transduction histidine kinase/CheY-like chemotaxis protein/HPt (histidine-containing phosphotransfer) domain-containing protein